MIEVLFLVGGFALGLTWPFGQETVARAAAMFSTDEHVRALRTSNERLSRLLAESYSERWSMSATVLHLSHVVKVVTDDRDHKAHELAMYRGTINGQAIGSA